MKSIMKKTFAFICDLHLSKKDTSLGGVCCGLGETTGVPSWIFRLIFLASCFVFGVGFFIYLAMWLLLPERETEDKSRTRHAIKYLEKNGYRVEKVNDEASLNNATL